MLHWHLLDYCGKSVFFQIGSSKFHGFNPFVEVLSCLTGQNTITPVAVFPKSPWILEYAHTRCAGMAFHLQMLSAWTFQSLLENVRSLLKSCHSRRHVLCTVNIFWQISKCVVQVRNEFEWFRAQWIQSLTWIQKWRDEFVDWLLHFFAVSSYGL